MSDVLNFITVDDLAVEIQKHHDSELLRSLPLPLYPLPPNTSLRRAVENCFAEWGTRALELHGLADCAPLCPTARGGRGMLLNVFL